MTEIITYIQSIVSPGCGGVLHSEYGIIKSPNFPQNFPANVECSWRIIAHEGNHLEMSYDSQFQIPDSSGSCVENYIKVHSQKSETRKLPLKMSSPKLQGPAGLKSLFCSRCGLVTANIQMNCCQQAVAQQPRVLWLLHITLLAAGFRAVELLVQDSWRISALVRTSLREHVRKQNTSTYPRANFANPDANCLSGCGANFTAPSGRVVSPNYPADYPHYSNCNYTIRAVQAVLILTFKTFEVEGKWKYRTRWTRMPIYISS